MLKSLEEQRSIVRGLPVSKKMHIKKICVDMKGQGVKEVVKKVQNYLTPVIKEISPIIVRELIVPYMIKEGKSYLGLDGKGLRLAGQGKKKMPAKKQAAKKKKAKK